MRNSRIVSKTCNFLCRIHHNRLTNANLKLLDCQLTFRTKKSLQINCLKRPVCRASSSLYKYSVTTVEKKKKHENPVEVKSLVISLQNNEIRSSIVQQLRREKPTLTIKGVTGHGPMTPIFISEYLTP